MTEPATANLAQERPELRQQQEAWQPRSTGEGEQQQRPTRRLEAPGTLDEDGGCSAHSKAAFATAAASEPALLPGRHWRAAATAGGGGEDDAGGWRDNVRVHGGSSLSYHQVGGG